VKGLDCGRRGASGSAGPVLAPRPPLTAVAASALVLLGAVCATPPKAPPPSAETKPPPDARAQVEALVLRLYRAVESLEPEKLEDTMTPEVVAIGLGPGDFFNSRPALLEELRQQLVPIGLKGETLTIDHERPSVAVAADHRSAWFFDRPLVTRERPNRPLQRYRPRVTGHLVFDQGWRLDALHVSLPVSNDTLYAAGSDKRLTAPEDPQVVKGKGTEQLVGLTRRVLDDLKTKVERTSDADAVVLIGTDAAEVFEGGAAFKKMARPLVAQAKKSGFSFSIEGGPRASLAPGGQSGWVIANVAMTYGTPKGPRTLVPFRSLWIFAEEKGLWSLVSEHQSVALRPEQRESALPQEIPVDPPDAGRPKASARKDAGVEVRPYD